MITIRNNLMADQASRHAGTSFRDMAASVARLSSGDRIVSAKDDAAGMAVRELLRADVAVYRQANRNAQDGISMLQTGEGALGKIGDILSRMKELAEQASTDSYSDQQRSIMNQEFQELAEEISRIAENTEFNGISLLNEDKTHNIHLGSKDGEGVVGVRGANMTAAGLDLQGTASTIVLGQGVADPNDTSYVVATDPVNEGMGVRFAEDGDLWAVFYGPGGRSMNGVATAFNTYASAPYALGGGRLSDEDPWHVDDSTYEPAAVVYNEQSGLYELHVTAYTNGQGNEITGIWNETSTDITWANSTVTQGEGVDTDASIDTVEQAVEAAHRVEAAIVTAQDQRARMGYTINRLEASSKVLGIQAENALASQSRISDVDVAREMAAMTRNQVVAQAGLSMLSQANSIPQIALQLLQSQSN